MVSWNANGIFRKTAELGDFLNEHDVDILLIQETHLRPCNCLKLPNYTVYRQDRLQGPKGGTAIALKSSILHQIPEASHNLSHTESTTIILPNALSLPLQISSIYIPPDKPFHVPDFHALLSANHPVLLAGDFNAKHHAWGCRVNNRKGHSLKDYSSLFDVEILAPDEPTHFSFGRPDILDIGLTKLFPSLPKVEVIPELSSDHYPILFEIDFSPITSSRPPVTRINWNLYPNHLQLAKVLPLNSAEEIDQAITSLSASIQSAINDSSKTYPNTPYSHRLPQSIRQLIRQKNTARKKAKITLDPHDKLLANRLCEQVKTQITDFKQESWRKFTSDLGADDSSNLYKLTKRLRQKRPIPILQPLHGPNGLVYTDDEKAETFAIAMEYQFSLNEQLQDPEVEDEVESFDPNDLPNSPIGFISPKEISAILPRQKTKSAPGPDNIPYNALKLLPPRGIALLCNIYNSCLRHSYFPKAWKHSKIIMIPKPGKPPNFPDSYRPISLLSCIGKTFERLLLHRLAPHAETHLPLEQFGFRAGLGTELQALRLVEFIQEGFQRKEHCSAVFLDVSKAFDRVWHDGLVYKLSQIHIPKYLTLIISSFLTNRSFVICHNNHSSSSHPIHAGVPQGSVLSPLLYNIYTYDIPSPPHGFFGLFADDTVIVTRSRKAANAISHLQDSLDSLEDYFTSWKISINPQKSQATFFTKRRTTPRDRPIINDTEIPWSPSSKYLGIQLDKSLTWKAHILAVKQKALISRRQLYPLLSSSSSLDLRTKRLLYTTILRPIITYGAAVWATASKTHFKTIETLQSKTLRIITGAPWYIRNVALRRDLQLPTLEDRIVSLASKTLLTAASHHNPLLREALNYDPHNIKKHKRPKQILSPLTTPRTRHDATAPP